MISICGFSHPRRREYDTSCYIIFCIADNTYSISIKVMSAKQFELSSQFLEIVFQN